MLNPDVSELINSFNEEKRDLFLANGDGGRDIQYL